MLALLLAALAAPFPQDVETVTETLAGGGTAVYQLARDADGTAVRHGDYEESWPDGSRKTSGRYRDGLRHGRWRTWHANGENASSGSYKYGLRDRKWTVWREDGTVVAGESGEFAPLELEFERGAVRSRGETRDGARHGSWTFYWESGVPKAGGAYVDGSLSGPWWFRHLDGTFDAEWISGVYEDGRRVGPLPPEWAAAEAARAVAIPEPGRGTAARAAERLLERFRGGDEGQREKARGELWESVLEDAFLSEALGRLDPEDDVEGALVEDLLRARVHPLFEGTPLWWPLADPAGPGERRLDALRWASLLLVADASYRTLGLPFDYGEAIQALRESGEPPVPLQPLVHPPLSDGSRDEALSRVADSPYRLRFEEREEGPGRPALDRALAWLVRHQGEDGSWDTDGFAELCEGEGACGDPGQPYNDVGLTALALLALLGDGNTSYTGPYRGEVGRGLRWLIEQQDPENGRIGEVGWTGWIYNHAAATIALSEALVFAESNWLRAAAQLAVTPILRARNPYSAWRYGPIPEGKNDTSVTGWTLVALKTAERAGLTVDPTAFEGGLSWIEEVTDPATGRCGYDEIGSPSARVEDVNDHYPPKKGEAMTAVALFTRILSGQSPGEEAMLTKHADLMLQKLPEWDPDGLGNDMYYWYYGTLAMAQMPEKRYWRPWSAALHGALLENQRVGGCADGSWDANGPWGYEGGRVYSTALLALCLEARWRYVVMFPEKK